MLAEASEALFSMFASGVKTIVAVLLCKAMCTAIARWSLPLLSIDACDLEFRA